MYERSTRNTYFAIYKRSTRNRIVDIYELSTRNKVDLVRPEKLSDVNITLLG
jgi:myo-inositol-hexaphosphate 3-phosphohydrolase